MARCDKIVKFEQELWRFWNGSVNLESKGVHFDGFHPKYRKGRVRDEQNKFVSLENRWTRNFIFWHSWASLKSNLRLCGACIARFESLRSQGSKKQIRVSLDRSRITQIGVRIIDIRLPKIQKGKNVQSRFSRVCSSVSPKWIRFSKSTANSTHPRWSGFFLETENWCF